MADQVGSSAISERTESPAATPASTAISENIAEDGEEEEDEDDDEDGDDDFNIQDEATMSPEEEAFFQQLIAGNSDEDEGDLEGGLHTPCTRCRLT